MKRILALCLVLLVLHSGVISAKGIPNYYILEGDDMLPMIFHLDVALVFDPQSSVSPAPQMDTHPYVLRSYARLENNDTVEFMLSPVHYYPDEGLIYFVGAADRGISQEFDGKWYHVDSKIAHTLDAYMTLGRQLQALLHVQAM